MAVDVMRNTISSEYEWLVGFIVYSNIHGSILVISSRYWSWVGDDSGFVMVRIKDREEKHPPADCIFGLLAASWGAYFLSINHALPSL